MKKSIQLVFVFFSFILFTGQQTQAAATVWKIDPIHSNFYFEIDHTYAVVRGYFKKFSGTFLFDENNLQESKIVFKIKAKSINTNERKRNSHLRTDEFLDVRKYPQIMFESKRIKHIGGNQYLVEGDLTIKDVTKTISFPLTFFGMKQNPLEPKEILAGFAARLTINRMNYHVGTGKFYEMGVVGKDVDILVTLEVNRKK
jgi:polyisoprenoid-binding protein YceI